MNDILYDSAVLEKRYRNAAKLQHAITDIRKVALNTTLIPHWINDHCFWYRRQTKTGDQFQLVDAKAGYQSIRF